MFVGLFVFLKRYIQQNKECKHHIKATNEFLLGKIFEISMRCKWDIYIPVHCIKNWCQLHHYHIFYIMRKQETIHLTTFSTRNWKHCSKLFRLFDLKFVPVSCDLIVISAYAALLTTPFFFIIAEKRKPTIQIINNWWLNLKYLYLYFLKIQLEL